MMVAARWDQRSEVRFEGAFVEERREARWRAWGFGTVVGRRRAAVAERRVVNGFRSILAVFEVGAGEVERLLCRGREAEVLVVVVVVSRG